jgi:threonine dehydrogenase-like Zn-dependent dehydrogenase
VRQLVHTQPGTVEWQDAPDPQLPDEHAALVEPLAVARCDLDAPMVERGLFPGPFAVGHEVAGRVVAVGPQVTRHAVGELVIVPYQISCGACGPCRAGTFAACATYKAPIGGSFGFGPMGGSHGGAVTDLLVVPVADHLLVAAPAGIPTTALATISDNVVDGYRSVGPPLGANPGADVLIVADVSRSVALYAAAAAVAINPGHVRYIGTDPESVQAAAALGADATHHDGAWPKRFDEAPITVDATGTPDGLATVLRSTARFGHCTILAFGFDPATPIPLLEMYTRGITVHASRADSVRYRTKVLKLLATTAFDPLAIPTTIRPWDQAADVWLEPATKLIIER